MPPLLPPEAHKPPVHPDSSVAAAASALLGSDVLDRLTPRRYNGFGETLPSEGERARVRALLLADATSNARLRRYPHSECFTYRDRQVRLNVEHNLAFRFANRLGECADSKCGCYRLWRPDVRRHFVSVASSLTMTQLLDAGLRDTINRSSRSVRYVTVGSGQLLTDFLILCTLREAGLIIESITAGARRRPTFLRSSAHDLMSTLDSPSAGCSQSIAPMPTTRPKRSGGRHTSSHPLPPPSPPPRAPPPPPPLLPQKSRAPRRL